MKITDTVRLATTNLRQNKRRSITVVATMAVIFGLVMGVGFFARGMWNLLLKSSLGQAEQTYLSLGYIAQGGRGGEEIESLTKTIPTLEDLVKEYGGETIGVVKIYDSVELKQVKVIDKGLARALAIDSLKDVQEGKIGMLVAESWDGMKEMPEQFMEVGEFRSSTRIDLEVDGFAPSNLLVGGIWNFGAPEYYLIEGAATEKYMEIEQQKSFEKSKEFLENSPATREEDWENLNYKKAPFVEIVAGFSNYERAFEFYNAAMSEDFEGAPMVVAYNGVSYGLVVDDFAGRHTISVIRAANYNTNVLLTPIIVVLAVVALLVAVSTFAHLVESDAATISLYRARGASTLQVYLIYLIYLLELCLLAVGLSIVFGLVLALGMSVMSAVAGFGEAVQGFFGLERAPFLILIGIDVVFWRSVGLMFLVVLMVMIMTSWRFSSRHIAKKLKEDM